jgi:hypothetical protein
MVIDIGLQRHSHPSVVEKTFLTRIILDELS